MGTPTQPYRNRRKSYSWLKKVLLLVVVVSGVYAGWGVWQDYQDGGHFSPGRAAEVATSELAALPRDVARLSTSAVQNLSSSSAADSGEGAGARASEQKSLAETTPTSATEDPGLPPSGLRHLSSPAEDPRFTVGPTAQNSKPAVQAATDSEAGGGNPQSHPQAPGSPGEASQIPEGISVWDSNTNQTIILTGEEYRKFQSNEEIPDTAVARNQQNSGSQPEVILPSSATSGLDRYIDHLLDLINESREEGGLSPVELGTNPAAHRHANSMLRHNFVGHWGLDGLTPTMRYTLAGGTGCLSQNVAKLKQQPYINHPSVHPLEALSETHNYFMESPVHRDRILNPWHTHVNLGIACNHVTCAVTQDFERDFVTFNEAPSINDGTLILSGSLNDKLALASVEVWYHETPHSLTVGQLDATYSYSSGQEPATFLLDPPNPGRFYSTEELQPTSFTWESDTDPYEVDPDRPRAYDKPAASEGKHSQTKMVPLTLARVWETGGSSFKIEANISEVIKDLGGGVYTVYIWGSEGANKVRLTNYSIFVN